ncbi:MAG TPA: hypothetical protein DD670_06345 [Planctomycetaceae bacterium]|nr:hypothetical protein [Planctomycetaceae bacterium]
MARVACAEISRKTGKQCRFAVVKPAEWWDPYVGVTEQNIRNCFRALGEAAQDTGMAVLFLDEIESIGRSRGSAVGQHADRFQTAFLAEMDGYRDRGNVAVIAATNRRDLCDPALLDRFDLVIPVERPDMRGAREIFEIHLPESMPYSPNGEAAADTRREVIDRAVSRLYSPNGDNSLCTIRFRDGKERVVVARELASGRSIEQICRATAKKAYLRYLDTKEHGVRVEDVDEAVSEAVERWATTLTPGNASAYLSNLPQDIDVVAVEPVTRRLGGSHQYVHTR